MPEKPGPVAIPSRKLEINLPAVLAGPSVLLKPCPTDGVLLTTNKIKTESPLKISLNVAVSYVVTVATVVTPVLPGSTSRTLVSFLVIFMDKPLSASPTLYPPAITTSLVNTNPALVTPPPPSASLNAKLPMARSILKTKEELNLLTAFPLLLLKSKRKS